MNFNVLRYVEAIAEEESFTKAAERLYVAQPSLSQAIRTLEQDLGAALFVRNGRSTTLTPAGERYLRWAKTVLRSEQQLRQELDHARGNLRKFAVGASPYRSKALLPEVVCAFTKQRPDCQIVLRDEYQTDLLELLNKGELDMVLDLNPAGGYSTEPVLTERILIAVHKRFALPLRKTEKWPKVSLQDLLRIPLINIRDHSNAGPLHMSYILKGLFERGNVPPRIALECCSAELAHILASKGLGFTVVSELFLQAGRYSDMDYCEIEEFPLTRQVCAIWQLGHPLSPDGRAFIDLLETYGESTIL